MAKMIDIGIANSDRPYILKMAGVLVLLGFVGLLLSVIAQYFAAKASVGFVKNCVTLFLPILSPFPLPSWTKWVRLL